MNSQDLTKRQRDMAATLAQCYPVTIKDCADLLDEVEWDIELAKRALDAGIGAGAIRLVREALKP